VIAVAKKSAAQQKSRAGGAAFCKRWSMIRESYRFSEKIMLKQKDRAR